ncbi:MAG: hypothetical protein AAF899_12475 [Pseudomonadota bacterium]
MVSALLKWLGLSRGDRARGMPPGAAYHPLKERAKEAQRHGLALREDDWSAQVTRPGDRFFFVRVERGMGERMLVSDIEPGAETPEMGGLALDLALIACGSHGPVSLSLPATVTATAMAAAEDTAWRDQAVAALARRRNLIARVDGCCAELEPAALDGPAADLVPRH